MCFFSSLWYCNSETNSSMWERSPWHRTWFTGFYAPNCTFTARVSSWHSTVRRYNYFFFFFHTDNTVGTDISNELKIHEFFIRFNTVWGLKVHIQHHVLWYIWALMLESNISAAATWKVSLHCFHADNEAFITPKSALRSNTICLNIMCSVGIVEVKIKRLWR